jgi:hypothetical protein
LYFVTVTREVVGVFVRFSMRLCVDGACYSYVTGGDRII